MNKETINTVFNFAEHEFPDIKLDKCGVFEYSPSQTDLINISRNSLFIIVKEGKGTVSISDKRYVLTKGSGIAVCQCENIKIKSDSIEPLHSYISIYLEKAHNLLFQQLKNGKTATC